MNKHISPKAINRLTLYHAILTDYIEKETEFISSTQIATILRLDQSQVRKDIQLLKSQGKCNVGYAVKELKLLIEQYLGFQKPKDTFIIGAGNLGLALAKYDDFVNYGLNILALFDIDPFKIKMTANGKEIFHINKLTNLIERLNIEIIILTVPRNSAQYVADLLSNTRIKYIWNFTPVVLAVPNEIEVWNENLIGNFLQFTLKI